MRARVLIVPTAGFIPGSKDITPVGIMRLEAADNQVKLGNVIGVAISGGYRADGKSEARMYCAYAKTHLPDLYDAIEIVDAQEACTNRDLVVLDERLSLYMKRFTSDVAIGVISYQQHMERAAIVLRHLGYQNIEFFDSGEPQAYPAVVETILTWITNVDPAWKWLGWPLVALANRRINT